MAVPFPGPEHRAVLQAGAGGSLSTLPMGRSCWTKVQTPTPVREFPPERIPLLPSPIWTAQHSLAVPGSSEAAEALISSFSCSNQWERCEIPAEGRARNAGAEQGQP